MSTITKYKPIPKPQRWQDRGGWTPLDLDDPAVVLSALTSTDASRDSREAVLYHATPAQLAAVTTHLQERERTRAQRIASELLTAAAEAQGHA